MASKFLASRLTAFSKAPTASAYDFRLRKATPDGQLKTLRYEDMVRSPGAAAAALSEFTGAKIAAPVVPANRKARGDAASWRRTLAISQVADIEMVAGEELRRLGYSQAAAAPGRP